MSRPLILENNMKFEVLEFQCLDTKGTCKGLATVLFDGEILVEGIKLLKLPSGYRVSMPTRKAADRYIEIVKITAPGMYKDLQQALIFKYERGCAAR